MRNNTCNPQVPATNNMAELAVRMGKVQQKISGRFRSRQGSLNQALIRTVLATARKQGWNMLETLRTSPEDLVDRLVDIPVQAPGQNPFGVPGHRKPVTSDHHHVRHWHQ